MKLLTKNQLKRFARIGNQDQTEDKIIVANLYDRDTLQEWYLFEYNPITQIAQAYTDDDFLNPVDIDIAKMETISSMCRDVFFKEQRISDLIKIKAKDIDDDLSR